MTFFVTLTGCEFISSTTFFVMGVLLTLKGYDSISNAMPSAWFSFDTFVALVHALFLHDLYPLLKKFLTCCLCTTPDLAPTYLYSTNQAQHQRQLAEYGPYDSILVDGEQRQIPFTLGDLSAVGPNMPGIRTLLRGGCHHVKRGQYGI